MIKDTELLRRYVCDSSEEAFAELVRRHIDWIYATACRLAGSASRAEDVTQTVFIDLSRKARVLAGRRDLLGWLHTSTRYASASLRRTEARREQRELSSEDYMERESAAAPLDWSRVRPIIDEELAKLPAADRELVLRRYLQGQSFPELACALGFSEDAARKRATRGLEKLRGRLARRGITSALVALELALSAQAAVVAPAHLAVSVTAGAVAAGSASVLSLWASSLALGAAALVALGTATGFTVRAHADATQARHELHAAQQHASERALIRSKIASDLAELRREQAELEREIAEQKARLIEVCSRGVDATLGAKRAEAILEMSSLFEELRPLWMQMVAGLTDDIHVSLFNKLALSAQERARLMEILFPSHTLPFKPATTLVSKNDGTTVLTGTFKVTDEIDENAVEVLLGKERFAIYEDHKRTDTLRRAVVDRLATQLVFSDQPLRAPQADRLVEILAAATPDPATPDPGAIDWAKVLPQAATVMSQSQVEMLARLSGNVSSNWKTELYGF